MTDAPVCQICKDSGWHETDGHVDHNGRLAFKSEPCPDCAFGVSAIYHKAYWLKMPTDIHQAICSLQREPNGRKRAWQKAREWKAGKELK
jgi:hypothetical protein